MLKMKIVDVSNPIRLDSYISSTLVDIADVDQTGNDFVTIIIESEINWVIQKTKNGY